MRDVMKTGSTHTSRCIKGLRRRAEKYNDDYLNVVADEMQRIYQSMYTARRALMLIQYITDCARINLARVRKVADIVIGVWE